MEYNVDGLLTKITLPDDRTVERKYDALGRVIETKDELGRVTKFDYDELGRLSRVTDPKGNVFSFVYDKVGNLIKVVDAKGNEVKTDYDELYRPSKFYDAYGKLVSQTQYNSVSLPIKVEDVAGRSLEFVYDSLYRLQETVLSGNIRAKAVYDALGRVVKVIDPKGYETSYQYDSLGNLMKEINPLGKEWNYQYDSIGRLVKSITPNGNTATYTYDNLDRIIKITLSSADGNQTKEITYAYDEVGNVLSVADDVGKIEYKYDINDRVTERKDVFGNVVKYVYDTVGRLSKLIYPDGKAVEYFYDEDDNLIKVKDWAGRETTFEYDANGNLVKVNYPNGAYTIYEYDANDRLTAVKNYAKDGKLITSNELQRNDAGDIIHITRVDYVKPDLSKIKPIHFTYNEFNQIVSSDEGEFTYDDNGNLLSYIYDGKRINLSYDLADRLVKAQIGNDTYEYTYDAEGNRVAVTRNGETKRYLVDNVLGLSKPLAEMDENNNILKYYIWTANGLTYSVDKDGHVYVYFYDYKGNTNAIINENNQLIAAYTYSVYGKILGSYERTGFENPFKFLGKFGVISDSEELYYIRARYYSPDLARWTQPDIVRASILEPKRLNRYRYTPGDPVNYSDINGKWALIDDAVAILGGAAVGVAGQFLSDVVSTAIDTAVTSYQKGEFTFKSHFSDWETYAGAAAGGAAAGEALLYTANPIFAGMAGGAVSSSVKEGIYALEGKTNISYALYDIFSSTALGIATSFLPTPKLPAPYSKGVTNSLISRMDKGIIKNKILKLGTNKISLPIKNLKPMTQLKLGTTIAMSQAEGLVWNAIIDPPKGYFDNWIKNGINSIDKRKSSK
jgi:RHS repeat-associated protein